MKKRKKERDKTERNLKPPYNFTLLVPTNLKMDHRMKTKNVSRLAVNGLMSQLCFSIPLVMNVNVPIMFLYQLYFKNIC